MLQPVTLGASPPNPRLTPADGAPTPSAVESDGRLCAIAWLNHDGPRAAFASPLKRHTDHLLASQKRWLARSSPSQDHVRPRGERRAGTPRCRCRCRCRQSLSPSFLAFARRARPSRSRSTPNAAPLARAFLDPTPSATPLARPGSAEILCRARDWDPVTNFRHAGLELPVDADRERPEGEADARRAGRGLDVGADEGRGERGHGGAAERARGHAERHAA